MYGFHYGGPSMHGVPMDEDEYAHLEHLERRESENEIATCCQGRNVNCGHHWGRGR